MITRIMIRNLHWMYQLCKDPQTLITLENIDLPFGVISIQDADNAMETQYRLKHLKQSIVFPCISLYFEDNVFDPQLDDPGYGEFNKMHANKILSFIHRLHEQEPNREYTLIVHCFAGMCRSGAIGEVVAEMVGITWQDLKKENPQILPNSSVRSLLRRIRDNG